MKTMLARPSLWLGHVRQLRRVVPFASKVAVYPVLPTSRQTGERPTPQPVRQEQQVARDAPPERPRTAEPVRGNRVTASDLGLRGACIHK